MKRLLALALAAALLLSGCGKDGPIIAETTYPSPTASGADFSQAQGEMFTARDLRAEFDESAAVRITLEGSTARASSNSVKISGSRVQITQEATYLISGTLDDGMLIVDAPDSAKVQLVFRDAHITSTTCAALYILQADKVVLTLAPGSDNSLRSTGSFQALDGNNIDAALFSKEDLSINGSGSLAVSSYEGHGIVCKDDLVVAGGQLQIEAASHAMDANDSIRFASAQLSATAGKDGLHCENSDDASLGFVYIQSGSLALQAEGDGISAGSYLHIAGGEFEITSGGGSENGQKQASDNWGGFMGGGHGGGPGGRPGSRPEETGTAEESSTSMKGLKAAELRVDSGSFTLNCADDALHSNGSMTVNGGDYQIATGDDALHAEQTLTVNGGDIQISTSYEGLEALNVSVCGGNIRLAATDDGLNAAGGTDSSGFTGGRDGMFGGRGPGGSGNSKGSIVISGGTLYIEASGDGIDANGYIEITGGYTTVAGPTQGDTATLDYDTQATISGGTFIGTGASGMAQTFSSSSQGVISVSAGSQAAGTLITLTDEAGNVIISYAPELAFQVVILSTPDMVSGQRYSIAVGAQSGEFEAD